MAAIATVKGVDVTGRIGKTQNTHRSSLVVVELVNTGILRRSVVGEQFA